MKIYLFTLFSLLGIVGTAQADVWMWFDAGGESHYVDTQTPIYTWIDSAGEVHYSDTPGSDSAISVKFVWYSAGSLGEAEQAAAEAGVTGRAGESDVDREERERAQAYYCKRATEIYESYLNAPFIYRTKENGEREYLSKQEKASTVAETRTQMESFCK